MLTEHHEFHHVATYEQPFGDYKEVGGTESFPCFDLCSPSFIYHLNSIDCGLASVANCLAFVFQFEKTPFKKEECYMAITQGRSNNFTLNSEHYVIEPFWDKVVKKARLHYADFLPKTGILKHMRTKFVKLLDNLLAARKHDSLYTSQGSVVDLLTPTKPAREGSLSKDVQLTVAKLTRDGELLPIEYGLRKTTWERRGETIDRMTHGQIKERKQKRRKTGCSAGASCHDPGREMLWLKSPLVDTNASKCYNCDSISHDCCSYLWNNHDFCIDCFKEEVMSKCSTIDTFGALLEKNKQSPRGRKAITLGAQDIRSSVDEYLCTEAKLDMNLEQYLEWKRNEKKSLKETASDPDKETWLERTRIYNIRKMKYNKCIAAAKEDWILSKDGVLCMANYHATCKAIWP